jgi:hypothetical protein
VIFIHVESFGTFVELETPLSFVSRPNRTDLTLLVGFDAGIVVVGAGTGV